MQRSLNLVPPALQRDAAMRRVKRVGVRAVLVSGAAVALLLGLEWMRGLASMRTLVELDARYAPFVALSEEQSILEADVTRLQAREQITLRLAREAVGLPLLGALSRAASASGGAVYVEALHYDGRSGVGDSQRGRSTDAAARVVRVQGVGVDGVAVAEFVDRLRQDGGFTTLAVESTAPAPGAAASVRQFVASGAF